MNRSTRNLPACFAAAGVLVIAALAYGPIQAQPLGDPPFNSPPPQGTQQPLDPALGATFTAGGQPIGRDPRPVPMQQVPAGQPGRPAAATVQGRPLDDGRGGGRLERELPIQTDPLNRFLGVASQPNPAIGRMQDQIRRATEGLRNAESDEQKAQAMQALKDTLNEYFESDLRRRAEELAQIEQRVKTLREQLDRRREKKQEIIDLQIKVAQNEADGLGFFGMPGGPSAEPGILSGIGTAAGAIYQDPQGNTRVRTTRPADSREVRPQDRRGPNPGGDDPFGGLPSTAPANPPLPAGPPRANSLLTPGPGGDL